MADGEKLAGEVLVYDTLRYFETMVRTLSLRLPENLAKGRVEAKLVLKVFDNGKFVSENEYDILIGSREWGLGNQSAGICCCFADDTDAKALLEYYRIQVKECGIAAELQEQLEQEKDSAKRLIVSRTVQEDEAVEIRKFAAAGESLSCWGRKNCHRRLWVIKRYALQNIVRKS